MDLLRFKQSATEGLKAQHFVQTDAEDLLGILKCELISLLDKGIVDFGCPEWFFAVLQDRNDGRS